MENPVEHGGYTIDHDLLTQLAVLTHDRLIKQSKEKDGGTDRA